jgi:hypothetical protein
MKKFKLERSIYLILLLALILRIPGVTDGLPAVYNSTEHFLARTVLSMGAAKNLDPGFYIYPTFYTYFLLILYGSLYLIGNLFGFFQTQYDFAVQFLINPSIIYIISRLINVFFSLLTIFITYRFLYKHASAFAANLAAVFMAISIYLIQFSGYATADTLMILFSTLTIIYLYKLSNTAEDKDIFYAGLFCGLAIAAKYNAGFLAAGLIAVVILKNRQQQVKLFSALGKSLAGIAVGFFATNPLWLIYPERFYQGWRIISSQMYQAVSAERGINFVWEITQIVQTEMVLGILFIVATVYFLSFREYQHYPAIIVILLTFVYVGTWTKKGVDYLFAVFPAWVILSAFFVDRVLHKQISQKYLRYILLALILIPSFVTSIYHFIIMVNPDTREEATEWIIASVRKDQSICYDNYHNDLGVFDIQRYISYGANADQIPQGVVQRLLPYSIDPRQVNFLPILVRNDTIKSKSANAYEEIAVQYKRRDLDELLHLGTSYLITNERYYKGYISINLKDYPPGVQIGIRDVQNFYQRLHQQFKPLKVFEPDFWQKGPKLSIYDLKK